VLHAEGPSQAGEALEYNAMDDTDDTILTHRRPQPTNPDTSTEARASEAANTDASMRGPERLPEQQTAQAEAFTANTIATYLIPQSSQQAPPSPRVNQDLEPEIKDFDDQQQEFEEENEASIVEELAYN
jgi:hypothetical protein